MTGLVEELQREALDPQIPVSTLLRKVKLTAVKLRLDDTVAWADSELSGYKDDVPDYRVVRGILQSHNHHWGWRNVGGDPQTIAALSTRKVSEPIGSLEALIQGAARRGDEPLIIRLPPRTLAALNESNGGGFDDVAVHIGDNIVVGIVEHVRNMVFNWALELEMAGISGEGISFNLAERERALTSNINIERFEGTFHQGDVTGSGNKSYVRSDDKSTNINSNNLFSLLSSAISEGTPEGNTKVEMLRLVRELEATQGGAEYPNTYQRFIAVAADHMALIGPFVPALTALIAS